jgi:steroid 5-alpha reductase family enzyme
MISNRVGWIVMEIPALLVFLWFALSSTMPTGNVVFIFILLWSAHYINRSLVFPFRIKTRGKKMPISVALMAVFFNCVNGFINGYYLGSVQPQYPVGWWHDPRLIAGLVLFVAGMWINVRADERLLSLRRNTDGGYQMPKGGLFEKVSCPNFFGEIVEWLGWAIMTWSLAGLSFFVWTAVNLIPRALDHHRWYKHTFRQYPESRKAVIPGIL